MSSDNAWKDELREKIRKVELAQQAAEAETKSFTAENEALNKEVERLRHLEQLRAVPVMPQPPTLLLVTEDLRGRITHPAIIAISTGISPRIAFVLTI